LPGRDGIDVCRDLRTRIDIPIIMVTAQTAAQSAQLIVSSPGNAL